VSINDAGQVLGTYSPSADPIQPRAFLYSGGSMSDIGTLGGVVTFAADINASGQVTGYSQAADPDIFRAYLYSNGTMVDLGALRPGWSSFANALNDQGQAVGSSNTVSIEARAALFSGGATIDLGTLGGASSSANDINELGQIVGHSTVVGSDPSHAFIYENGAMTDLNRYAGDGWLLTNATAINNRGDILGFGTLNGEWHTFLLTSQPVAAVPEPSTFALLGAGLAGLVAVNRRRRKQEALEKQPAT
jgi:probable HAF family extracellular repeat protein